MRQACRATLAPREREAERRVASRRASGAASGDSRRRGCCAAARDSPRTGQMQRAASGAARSRRYSRKEAGLSGPRIEGISPPLSRVRSGVIGEARANDGSVLRRNALPRLRRQEDATRVLRRDADAGVDHLRGDELEPGNRRQHTSRARELDRVREQVIRHGADDSRRRARRPGCGGLYRSEDSPFATACGRQHALPQGVRNCGKRKGRRPEEKAPGLMLARRADQSIRPHRCSHYALDDRQRVGADSGCRVLEQDRKRSRRMLLSGVRSLVAHDGNVAGLRLVAARTFP